MLRALLSVVAVTSVHAATDCDADTKYAVSADQAGDVTCDAKTNAALGGACHTSANTTKSTTALTSLKMTCVPKTGETGTGLLACADGKMEHNASCTDPAVAGSCDAAAIGTPNGDAANAKKTTATANTFKSPAGGYKCMKSGTITCDFAGGYKMCGTACKKTDCAKGSIDLGKGCGSDADCKATTGNTNVKCVGVGSAAKCLCPGLAAAGTQKCAATADDKMEVTQACEATGSNMAAGYTCANSAVACASGYTQTQTTKKCMKFNFGQECASLPAGLTEMACASNKIACTGTNKVCTSNPTQCAASATDAACKCAAGEIVSNATNNPCVALKVGASCKDLQDAKQNAGLGAPAGYACTTNAIACAATMEKCAAGANANTCVADAADPALCPAAAAAATTATSGAQSAALSVGLVAGVIVAFFA